MTIGRIWTISVGVNDYGGRPELGNLTNAVNDACLVHETLSRRFDVDARLLASVRDIAGGPHADLVPEAAAEGTREDIIDALADVRRRAEPDDALILYFSGHGVSDPMPSLLPKGVISGQTSTYLPHRRLTGALLEIPCAHQLMILDCCFAVEALGPRRANAPIAWVAAGARLSAIAAAGTDHPEAFDGLAAADDNAHSPFATALAHVLTSAADKGAAPSAEDLFAGTSERIRALRPENAAHWPAPEFKPDVHRGRPGVRRLRLRPIAFSVRTPEMLRTEVGRPATLELGAAQDGRALQWDVAPRTQSAHTVHIVPTGGGTWRLTPTAPGLFEFELTAVDPTGGARTLRRLQLDVRRLAHRPMRVDRTPPPCRAGAEYEVALPILDGAPPFAVRVLEKPDFLRVTLAQAEDAAEIRLFGSPPPPRGAGSPSSDGLGPVVREVRVRILDAARETLDVAIPIPVLSDADYRFIPAGEFRVGYSSGSKQDARLGKALDSSVAQLIKLGKLTTATEQERRRFGSSWTKETVDRVSMENPAGVGTTATYFIKAYPVTNHDWRIYLDACPDGERPQHWGPPGAEFTSQEAAVPVVNISYAAICKYLAWKGTRLPTAWEWERAARGDDGRLFPWGEVFDPKRANTLESGEGKLVPSDHFGDRGRSPHGCFDMVGNAAEWVDQRRYSPTSNSGGRLVQRFRGGSFLDPAPQALAFLDSAEVGVTYGDEEGVMQAHQTTARWIGFRDVIDVDAGPPEPQGWVRIPESDGEPEFLIARYAVTNEEFLAFVNETGHAPPPGWAKAPEPPFLPADRHLPVARITFLDALAYCLWASRRLGGIIRPPTPSQWRQAARGVKSRIWPWGDAFDSQRCNAISSGWGRRLPVYALPNGRTPEGVCNLVGNVAEWVAANTVCGGGWADDCEALAKTDFEQRVKAANLYVFRRSDVGLRCAALPFADGDFFRSNQTTYAHGDKQ